MQRLVSVPEDRDQPLDCLRALREVSERAEMVYAANGMWWLGVVADDTPAIEEGYGLLSVCREREAAGKPVRRATYLKAELMTQGFRLLAAMGAHNGGTDPSPSACVAAFLPAWTATFKQEEAANDRLERDSDGTTAREESDSLLRGDFLQYHARDVFRTAKRFSVTVPTPVPAASAPVETLQ